MRLQLRAENIWTRVEGLNEPTRKYLYDYLAVEAADAAHNPAVRNHHWDGLHRLYDKARDRFPTGLMRIALGGLKSEGVGADVEDLRKVPCAWVPGQAEWLYPDQAEALEACRIRTRGIVQAPTGSGKTECFVGAAASVPDARVVLLTGSKDLMHQAADRFERRTGEPAGRIGDGDWKVQRFTAATYQAVHRARAKPAAKDLFATTDMLIVDEGHELPAASFCDTAMSFTQAYWRFGFSATPCLRRDAQELKMMACLGPVIHVVDPAPLIASGRLARPDVYFLEHNQEKGAYVDQGWATAYDAAVVHNDARNAKLVAVAAAEAQKVPTLMFCKSLEHGSILVEMLRAQGVSAAFVSGETPHRMRYAEQLVRRDLGVLVASKVFFTGVDIPEAVAGVNAGAGDSPVDCIQRLGRLTRGPLKVPGKTNCRYYDVRDLGQHWLSRHAKHRWEVYAAYGAAFVPQLVREGEGIQHRLG